MLRFQIHPAWDERSPKNADVVKNCVTAWGLCRERRVRSREGKLRQRVSTARLTTDKKYCGELFPLQSSRKLILLQSDYHGHQ